MYRDFILKLLVILFLTVASHNNILAQQSAQTYESIIRSANEKFSAKDYVSAKTYYEMALRLRENDTYAKNKLTETISLIQKQLEQQGVFYSHLDQGDRLYKDGKLKEALQSYQKALEIFPDDKYTLGQVAKINETIQTANKKQEDYTKSMELGDQLVQANKFEEALLQFNQAALLFPDLPLPKEKIVSTTKLLAEQKDKELQFSKLKEDAKTLITRKNYQDAIDKLNEALKIYPKDIDVNNLLSETQALYAKSLQYNEMLASADASYENKNLEQSKVLYEKALAIWPEQAYPADMIQKINTTLNSVEHQRATLVPKYLAEAQLLFDSKKFEQAIEVYNTILEIDPENTIANDRLVEISFLITQQKAEQQALAEFESLLKKGDQAVNEKKYDEALVAYKKAEEILPNDKNIAAKIASTEKILNDQRLLAEKSDKYQQLIAAGDNLYQQSELEKAKLSYQEASTLDTEKAYPKDQIILIDKKLSELAATQQLDNEFNTFMATAQQRFDEKNWNAAKTSYSKASQLKPESQLPKQQIEAIDRILAENAKLSEEYNNFIASGAENLKQNKLELALEAYQNAASIKPDEQLPKEKIESITLLISEKQSIAQKEKEYSDLIILADKQYGNNEFDTSLENYRKASLLFADRAYPTTQIGLINKVKEENAAAIALEETYNNTLQTADNYFKNNEYQLAIDTYKEAITLKSGEQYPKDQINKSTELLASQIKTKETNRNYTSKIEQADQLFKTASYEAALIAYKEALKIKPSETYPQTQIKQAEEQLKVIAAAKELEKSLDELQKQGDSYLANKQLKEADSICDQMLALNAGNAYATAKKTEIAKEFEALEREKQAQYEQYIAQGDAYFAKEEFSSAIKSYNSALVNKPNDKLVKDKLTEAENILNERLLALKAVYNKHVTEADKNFNSKNYDKAIDSYLKAEGVKPDEKYPREMIQKISQIMIDNKIRELNSENVLIASNTSKKFSFEPVDVSERRSNYILIKARNTGKSSFPLLVNFGSKTGRNGGFVLPIPESDTYNDFIVQVGSQYKWFSEDNIWIELIPENGEVEVTIIQISKGN